MAQVTGSRSRTGRRPPDRLDRRSHIMFPWFWFWAPQVHLPFSGSVAQRIEPDTNWFFGAIAPEAGDGRIEQKAFAVASYGRQLGLVAEVLIDLAEQQPPRTAKGRDALARLKEIQARIEDLKDSTYEEELLELQARIQKIRRQGGPRKARLEKQLVPLLADR